MSTPRRIAILGAGIMGGSLALYLARRGAEVTLFDTAAAPFSAASRWNEGKIHLGFLYNADPSLRTARHMIPGGLLFQPLVEELIGCSIGSAISEGDDIYLCHRDSVVDPAAMEQYMIRVAGLLREHPDAKHYLADVSECSVQRMSESETETLGNPARIVAGFRTPERSVETTWIADRFVDAITAEPRITLQMNTHIEAARPEAGCDGPWCAETSMGSFGGFDCLVNALWQGRMAVDQTAGIPPAGIWSNRYRLSLFARTSRPLHLPCVVIATGPYGDIKNYNNRDFYLSWYPAGLLVDSSEVTPPGAGEFDVPDPSMFREKVFEHLCEYLPWTAEVREHAEQVSVAGGWVFAAGRGALSDPSSTLHRRSEYGVIRMGSYYSIDTGKYSTAPWVARSLADQICS